MRILAVLPRIPYPMHDGAAIVMYRTLQTLREMGHEVHVFALNPSRIRSEPHHLKAVCSSMHVHDIDTDVRTPAAVKSFLAPRDLSSFGLKKKASYWLERFLSEEALDDLLRYASDFGYVDMVLCETLFSAAYGAALRHHVTTLEESVFVLRAHNIEHRIQERMSKNATSPLHSWYRQHLARTTRTFEMEVADKFDVVAAISEHDASVFRSHLRTARVVAVLPGVVLNDPLVHLAPTSISFLGSLDWAPNVEGVLWFIEQVLPLITAARDDVKVVIGGRHASRLRHSLKGASVVALVEEVPDAIVFRRSHGINIVPLLSGSGVRIKILEALSAACPVVTTTLGNEGLPFEHQEHLLVADTPEEFARACLDMMDDPQRAQDMARQGRAMITNDLTWQRSVQQLLDAATQQTR